MLRRYHKGLLASKIHVNKSITINKSPAELYQFWRNFENLPQFMTHLESVTVTDEKRSHWKAKAPLGTSVEWDAEITSDIENERIGWKSIEGSEIPNSGVVEFRPTTNRGTEVKSRFNLRTARRTTRRAVRQTFRRRAEPTGARRFAPLQTVDGIGHDYDG